jgi:2-hydroxychromene-2-carboxylate isomerase
VGELIFLSEHVADRSRPNRSSPVAFFYDLGSPVSYLAAERVERTLGAVDWIPTAPLAAAPAVSAREAELEALMLRLPLVWPDGDGRFSGAMRAAARAAELGRSTAFALAASRLAFCGGYDLDDPEILSEAAAAAGLAPRDCLEAAGDPTWDTTLRATADGLARRGVRELPAIRVGRVYCSGREAVTEAAALVELMGLRELHSA